MNEAQMRQVVEWFRNQVGTITCSVCSSQEFKFDAELTTLPVWRSHQHPHVNYSDAMPAVILTCSRCASIRLFSAEKMGLLPGAASRPEETKLSHG